MSYQEKVSRARELKAEAARLIQEAEAEYFTQERLDHFWERFRTVSFTEVVSLISVGHPAHEEEFRMCYAYCPAHRLYGFASPTKDTSGPQEVVKEPDTALRRNPLNPSGPNDDSWRNEKLAAIAGETSGTSRKNPRRTTGCYLTVRSGAVLPLTSCVRAGVIVGCWLLKGRWVA
jgi:hypothetical protein